MAMTKECWSCFYYRAFYTKGYCQFDKQDMGMCKRTEKIVDDKHHTCECWRINDRFYNSRKAVALRKITDMLDCMVEIKQILAEDSEESKRGS